MGPFRERREGSVERSLGAARLEKEECSGREIGSPKLFPIFSISLPCDLLSHNYFSPQVFEDITCPSVWSKAVTPD